jgi:hypothetical protein
MSALPQMDAQTQYHAQKYQQKQSNRSSIYLLNILCEEAYNHCVHQSWFGTYDEKELTDAQSKCVQGFVEKRLTATLRTGQRFREAETVKMEKLMEVYRQQQGQKR